ncbi:hypothetical protein PVAR5_5835 [Paecilomyces variotii No. 5]|uniref:Uncharacterized protein n=1 Tax=Byssochlamys spectabilis (strain No. 5 / NBRC 109023) TaxID=1356009 RepID=V5FHH7_BYSSN|nr:hypothetical protein PVAR5_5835 [Paecilomyces variotii No. 5]
MSAVATPVLNDTLPKGDRKKRSESDDSTEGNEVAKLAGQATGNSVTKSEDKDDKGSLNIRIHLDLKVKVKLELDAEIYGDVVIDTCNNTNMSFPSEVPFQDMITNANTTVDYILIGSDPQESRIFTETSLEIGEDEGPEPAKESGTMREFREMWRDNQVIGEFREIWREDRDTLLQITVLLVLWVLYCKSSLG